MAMSKRQEGFDVTITSSELLAGYSHLHGKPSRHRVVHVPCANCRRLRTWHRDDKAAALRLEALALTALEGRIMCFNCVNNNHSRSHHRHRQNIHHHVDVSDFVSDGVMDAKGRRKIGFSPELDSSSRDDQFETRFRQAAEGRSASEEGGVVPPKVPPPIPCDVGGAACGGCAAAGEGCTVDWWHRQAYAGANTTASPKGAGSLEDALLSSSSSERQGQGKHGDVGKGQGFVCQSHNSVNEEQGIPSVVKEEEAPRELDEAEIRRRRKKGDLPDKVFVTRRSVLTELFEISHIQTIYHIFVAILIVFSLNTIVYDVLEKGTFSLNFGMIQWAFGKFPKVMVMWVVMQLSTLLIVYPAFYYWATQRRPGNAGLFDFVWIGLVVVYQLAFLFIPLWYLIEHDLPPASSVIITTEQTRLIMKTHAFIRENTAKVMYKKKDDDRDKDDGSSNGCPDFSKYLYFLFSPTLVYRDNYPRTQTICWRYVVTNFTQVLACLFYTYYIFERFCVPVFQNFNSEHITPKAFLLSVFGCMMPATLVLFIGFFAILHSWLNAFAEMLRFGDRLFYKDWWNSTTFSNYYRTWNVVVHDWLYTYIYKDICKLIGAGNRAGAMACVFLISAVFHEYILTVTFKFFYPVLFIMFAGAGFGFIFLTDKGSNRSWNVFMWVALFIGNGMLMCLYSMEFYARQNCPVSTENFLDYIIPRSWFCDLPASPAS
ncbi:sterol O-acyltransferase 1 isoform X1 [Aplysia californica]|uniref:Sterol O-acyltransferase 1 isoform X1 n=1 Tax=Aplysia californica TaxID=6500 RepID=A0ABM0JV76_APLCA|nr:sterol O-acyltransferase 1 isoform X1 [Aplysia californica]